MGLLSAAQLAAIESGAALRQVWTIHMPDAAGSTDYVDHVIHDDADPTYQRVVDAGSREVCGYNISLREPGKLETGSYAIVVDNGDGYFCPNSPTTNCVFYDATSAYTAEPQECDLSHKVYVMVAGSWSELTVVSYRGKIEDIEYSEVANASSVPIGVATIETRARVLREVLERKWSPDDGDDVDTDFDVTGP